MLRSDITKDVRTPCHITCHTDTIEITQQSVEEWSILGLGTCSTLLGNVYCLDIGY